MALPAITNWDASVAGVLFGAQGYLWWEWGEWALPALSLRMMHIYCVSSYYRQVSFWFVFLHLRIVVMLKS